MMRQWKNRKIILALIVLITMGIFTATVCFAGEKEDASINDTTPQIKEIPGMVTEGNTDFVREAEIQHYDVTGTVDDVQKEGIVVNDSYFKKAPNAKMSGASKGAHVGLFLNSDGEFTVCERIKKINR